jgi:hypothetical protein
MKKVTVEVVDDLSGAPIRDGNGRTISFAFDGQKFEIDLSNDNIQAMRDALDPFIRAARQATPKRRAPQGKNPDLQVIRDWANSNGFAVSDRGRVAAPIREAYEASHPDAS